MVVCGDDALAHRLAVELRSVYGEHITLVVPLSEATARPPVVGRARAASAALLDRVNAAVGRANGNGGGTGGGGGNSNAGPVTSEPPRGERVLEVAELTEAVFAEAGVERATALALVYDDDETNIRAALTARRLNPRIRLVLRLYNRRLGQHIEELLDQAAALATGDGTGTGPGTGFDASTTVLSDADTAAPALAATALAGTSKVVQTDGLLLRAVERPPPGPGEVADPGLATLALLSATSSDPARTAPRAWANRARACCPTRRPSPRPPGAEPSSWSRCRTPGRSCRAGAGAVSCPRSPRSSRGGCGGRWRACWRVSSRSPSRCGW